MAPFSIYGRTYPSRAYFMDKARSGDDLERLARRVRMKISNNLQLQLRGTRSERESARGSRGQRHNRALRILEKRLARTKAEAARAGTGQIPGSMRAQDFKSFDDVMANPPTAEVIRRREQNYNEEKQIGEPFLHPDDIRVSEPISRPAGRSKRAVDAEYNAGLARSMREQFGIPQDPNKEFNKKMRTLPAGYASWADFYRLRPGVPGRLHEPAPPAPPQSFAEWFATHTHLPGPGDHH